jgi:hypothetical protein
MFKTFESQSQISVSEPEPNHLGGAEIATLTYAASATWGATLMFYTNRF